MKYIKTEDGIFGPLKDNDFILEKGRFFGKPILKVANGTKELCDEIVVVDIDGRHLIIHYDVEQLRRYIKNLYRNGEDADFEVYGAAWVVGEHGEPILKSVAKLNKRGEWELL